jgi:murein DD-endopeptidase MepM/ murein hydrolase activator NlpD
MKSERFPLIISLIVLVLSTASFSWPVRDGKITSTFGESRGDHFHDGIDMVNRDNRVYPVASGRLVYYRDRARFPLDRVAGGGNYAVLSHNDAYYSVYMHLRDGVDVRGNYSQSDIIGLIGNTGHSYGAHLHFTVIEKKDFSSINPMVLIGGFEDKREPEIGRTALRIGKKLVYIRDGANIRLTRHYPLLVEIRDTIQGNERLGIYKIEAEVNGEKVHQAQFRSLEAGEKGMTFQGQPFYTMYDREGLYRIDGIRYKKGENSVVIRAWDMAGNQTEKAFRYTITLDMKQ